MKSSDKMYSIMKSNQSSKVWRNAYYLSTSIEEDNSRHDLHDANIIPTQIDYAPKHHDVKALARTP